MTLKKMIKEKIAYFHGYNGSSNGLSFQILAKHLKDFELIGIDYDEQNPNIEHIKKELKSLGINKVIGSSLGGFITLNLGNEFKKLVFNPCMKPSVELPKLGATEDFVNKYSIIENEYFKNLKGDNCDKETTYGFFGNSDELFGPYGYKFLFKSYYKNGYNMRCGHRITDEVIKRISYRIIRFFSE